MGEGSGAKTGLSIARLHTCQGVYDVDGTPELFVSTRFRLFDDALSPNRTPPLPGTLLENENEPDVSPSQTERLSTCSFGSTIRDRETRPENSHSHRERRGSKFREVSPIWARFSYFSRSVENGFRSARLYGRLSHARLNCPIDSVSARKSRTLNSSPNSSASSVLFSRRSQSEHSGDLFLFFSRRGFHAPGAVSKRPPREHAG